MEGARHTTRGSALWDFLYTFITARRVFLSIFKRYERRVLKAARERGVDRSDLVLPPQQLWKLFHLRRLELLRDQRLGPLRELSQQIFGDSGDEGLMDAYCGHMYHEISILSEEHQSVGRFVRHHDPRRYRALFEEVSGYYPTRLRRVKRFFASGMKRLDELLPRWSSERVVIRSTYLFGDRLARLAYGRGREALYQRMYPRGGAIRGYLTAARSFMDSGFTPQAGAALGEAARIAKTLEGSGRDLMTDDRAAIQEVQEMMVLLMGGAKGAAAGVESGTPE